MTHKNNLQVLTAKRNAMFQQLVDNPLETHIAIEIKALDDQIAASTQRMREENRNASVKLTLAKRAAGAG